jgi:prepilin-type N-terminal cleavage/methylation domain-containing protein
MHAVSRRRTGGFTLIELMVVVAVIGVVVGIAVMSMRAGRYAKSSYGYAERISAVLEAMRMRAIGERRWQDLQVNGDQLIHWESEYTGMGRPADPVDSSEWHLVEKMLAPHGVRVVSVVTQSLLDGGSVITVGAGLGLRIRIAPDGTASPATIFISDESGQFGDNSGRTARVVVLRATASTEIYKGF